MSSPGEQGADNSQAKANGPDRVTLFLFRRRQTGVKVTRRRGIQGGSGGGLEKMSFWKTLDRCITARDVTRLWTQSTFGGAKRCLVSPSRLCVCVCFSVLMKNVRNNISWTFSGHFRPRETQPTTGPRSRPPNLCCKFLHDALASANYRGYLATKLNKLVFLQKNEIIDIDRLVDMSQNGK